VGGGAAISKSARLILEHADELLPDALALLLRVRDAFEAGEKALARVDVDERHAEVAPERLDDLGCLVLAQKAVVDEHAGELVADGLVHEQRGDGRIDTARERAENAGRADLRADARRLLLDHRRRRP
jgi:hypothetical protein